jgi:hypothetical protein
MSGDIAEAKQRLPLPALLYRLGLRQHSKKSARCPFHEDQHNSFSVWKNGAGIWFWKCHTGCGEGDEITFLEKHHGISNKEATKRFLAMAGGNGVTPPPYQAASRTTAALDWQACVQGFTKEHGEQVAKCRGYSIEFCCWLKGNGLVGLHNGCIAFPVHDRAGNVVACHYRLKDGSWRYYPQGAKVRPLVIGELVPGDTVYVFESYWDAFAFMDKSGEYHGIITTRGAGNGALVADVIPQGAKVYLWPQNDAAGEKWAKDICDSTKAAVMSVKVTAQLKDLNDWTRAGATSADLRAAMVEAAKAATIKGEKCAAELALVLDSVCEFLRRHVVFASLSQPIVIALWIAHTWILDAFDCTPFCMCRLLRKDPERQSCSIVWS